MAEILIFHWSVKILAGLADKQFVMGRHSWRLGVVALLLLLCVLPGSGATVYSVFFDDRFGTIDSTTGTYTQIGTLPIAQTAGIGVLGNVLYVQSMQGELLTVNPVTGASTVVGNADLSTTSEIFAGDADGLFEFDSQSNLYSINPTTGASTLIGATGLPPNNGGWDTSMSADGTDLFVTAGGGGKIDELYEINTVTGLAVDLGSTGLSSIAGSAIAGDYLDLFQYSGGTNYIYSAPLGSTSFTAGPMSVEIVDGGVTLTAGESFTTAAATPESSASVLLGLGLVILGLIGRIRHVRKAESRRRMKALP
jgi:hypothetical protein